MHVLFLKSPIACSLFQSPLKPKLRISLSAIKDRCSYKVSHNIRKICTLPAGSKESPLLLQCPSLPPSKFLQCVCHVQCGLCDLGSALSSERCWSPSFLKKKGEICPHFFPQTGVPPGSRGMDARARFTTLLHSLPSFSTYLSRRSSGW